MNIFYLSNNVKECAQMHTDKHCLKMIIEYAQLLSTAHRVLDGAKVNKGYVLGDHHMNSIVYKATHVNHPSSIWVRQSKQNYNWLYDLWVSLMDEYSYRYGRVHASSRLMDVLKKSPRNLVSGQFTEPTPAMPDEYKVKNNSIQSYRNYYKYGKAPLHSWKDRDVPNWITTK